jgi:hypothetical protein
MLGKRYQRMSCDSSRSIHVGRPICFCGVPLILYANMSERRTSMNTKCQVACWLNDTPLSVRHTRLGAYHSQRPCASQVRTCMLCWWCRRFLPVLCYSCSPISLIDLIFVERSRSMADGSMRPATRNPGLNRPCGAPPRLEPPTATGRVSGTALPNPPLVQRSRHLVGHGTHIEFSR